MVEESVSACSFNVLTMYSSFIQLCILWKSDPHDVIDALFISDKNTARKNRSDIFYPLYCQRLDTIYVLIMQRIMTAKLVLRKAVYSQ